jgi:hypothetical protein
MLNNKRASIDSTIFLQGFDTSRVFAYAAIGAMAAYGAFGRFYFEITISGARTRSAAIGELRKFFRYFEKSAGN